MKKVVAASVNKMLEFDAMEEFEKHIHFLESRKRKYLILSKQEIAGGKIRIEIKEQYNNNTLL